MGDEEIAAVKHINDLDFAFQHALADCRLGCFGGWLLKISRIGPAIAVRGSRIRLWLNLV
jgi:hypothetical protein